jgi:hypothetical protein
MKLPSRKKRSISKHVNIQIMVIAELFKNRDINTECFSDLRKQQKHSKITSRFFMDRKKIIKIYSTELFYYRSEKTTKTLQNYIKIFK